MIFKYCLKSGESLISENKHNANTQATGCPCYVWEKIMVLKIYLFQHSPDEYVSSTFGTLARLRITIKELKKMVRVHDY